MKTIRLQCHCGEFFERRKADVDNSRRRGFKHICCSRSCSISIRNKMVPSPGWASSTHGNRRDEFTGLRWFMSRVKRREPSATLTLQDIKDQWDRQGGKCVYTGWVLSLPAYHLERTESKGRKRKFTRDLTRASLDRIDSSKGYEHGNIQFVCLMANIAKSDYASDDLIRFCRAVANHSRRISRREPSSACRQA